MANKIVSVAKKAKTYCNGMLINILENVWTPIYFRFETLWRRRWQMHVIWRRIQLKTQRCAHCVH